MQLFLLDHINNKNNEIIIDNPELRNQAKKVLRLETGDVIFLQEKDTRYEVEMTGLRDLKIFGKVKNTTKAPCTDKPITTMLIAMPNKWEKVELIVQKLCEIGIENIVFRPAERSIIKTWNEKKEERLSKIVKEAVEQSWGRHLPTVTFSTTINEWIKDTKLIVFDKNDSAQSGLCEGNEAALGLLRVARKDSKEAEHDCGIIGPEGGLTPNDYKHFQAYKPEIRDLGDTVLRMETAAIVGGWILKNC